MVRHYQQLIAWQKAVAMVTDIYRMTQSYPREELHGLTSQTRRSAVSVPCNIAEGSARRTPGGFVQFLGHSYGSMYELETQIIVARNLGFLLPVAAEKSLEQSAEVGRIINGPISSLTTDH